MNILKPTVQILPKTRDVDLLKLAITICNDELSAVHIRDLFFGIARQTAFFNVAHAYGLTYVPQYGSEAGKIFHFMTAARVADVSVTDLIQEHTRVSNWDDRPNQNVSLPSELAFVFDELSHYSDNSIGVVWCVVDVEQRTKNVEAAVRQCAQSIEFVTQKLKLAQAITALIKLNTGSKTTEVEIDNQVVSSLASAICPEAVMIWRVDRIRNRLLACAGTQKWSLHLNMGEGAVGRCAVIQQTMVINDLKDPQELKAKGVTYIKHVKFIDALSVRAAIYEPIILGSYVDSVIACYFRRPAGVTQTEIDIIRFICNNYRYYRSMLKVEISKSDDREKLQRIAALVTFARDARSYVHDAMSLVSKSDHQLFAIIPRTNEERSAKQVIVETLAQARKHLSVALTLSEPPKTVRSGNVLFESDKDISKHNIIKIVNDVVAFYEAELGKAGIAIRVISHDDVRFTLSAAQFRRALTNIIDNAIFALKNHPMVESKRIEVEIRLVEEVDSNARRSKEELIIHVRDNGPGIDKEIYNNLSEYFSTTKGDEGYGFGMAIVSDIMHAHGGKLFWRNNKGRGAEFELRFPQPA